MEIQINDSTNFNNINQKLSGIIIYKISELKKIQY